MIFKSIVCSNCKHTIATKEDIYSRTYVLINGDYFCENCVDDFRKNLTENLKNEVCCECNRKLITGDELYEEAEYYYKINNDLYCVDCIDKLTGYSESIDNDAFIYEPDYEED